LTEEFNKIRDSDDSLILAHMKNYYSEDFLQLKPILTTSNEDEVAIHILKRKSRVIDYLNSSRLGRISRTMSDDEIINNIDDLEEIIGDEAYASFLNSSAEVQVGDSIFKYTDVGLFIVKDTEYPRLDTYLETRAISKDLLVPTPIETQEQIHNEIPNGGTTNLGNGLVYFRAPFEIDNSFTPAMKGNNQSTHELSFSATDAEMTRFVSNLLPCDGRRGLFGNLFGANKICIDEYENRRRIKTKAFAYNFGLAYHTGVKVKHQYKGWTGIWRKEDVEILSMGILAAQFEYDFSSWMAGNSIVDESIVTFSAKGYNEYYTGSLNRLDDYLFTVKVEKFIGNPYPFSLFNDDVVIEKFGNNDIVELAIKEGNKRLTSEKLNEYFWKSMWGQTTTQLKRLTKNPNFTMPDNVTLLAKYPKFGTFLIQKSDNFVRRNESKVDKTYDWGFGASITLSASNGYSIKEALKHGTKAYNPQRPKRFGVIMYGVCKRSGAWHGSRLEM
jgi:hypothetical protein